MKKQHTDANVADRLWITPDPIAFDPSTVPSLDDVAQQGAEAGMECKLGTHSRERATARGKQFASLLQYPNAEELMNAYYLQAYHETFGNLPMSANMKDQPANVDWRGLTNRFKESCKERGYTYDPYRNKDRGIGLDLKKWTKAKATGIKSKAPKHTKRTAGDGPEFTDERIMEFLNRAIQSGQINPDHMVGLAVTVAHKTKRGRVACLKRLVKNA